MKHPNILFIMTDQMRHDALACNGNPVINTPNYDRLAAEGVNFSNSFSTNPICVPARATIITGCYSHKCTGTKNNSGAIRDGFPLLPEILAEQGYETYSAGKLHYLPYAAPDEPRLTHGFQHVKLCESGRILSKFDPKAEKRGVEDYIDYLADVGWAGYSRADAMGNNDVYPNSTPIPEEHYVDSWVADCSLTFLEEHLKKHPNKPFFLHASFPKPHSAFDPPHPWDRMYDPRTMPLPQGDIDLLKERELDDMVLQNWEYMWDLLSPQAKQTITAHYYGLISLQDKQVGRILDFLDARNLTQDTIIVYTSDHGEMLGDLGLYFKVKMYNGSIRVPLMFAYPAKLPQGTVCDMPAGIHDIMPTLLSLADIPLNAPVDGIDLTPAMLGKYQERTCMVSHTLESPRQQYMVADKEYKYIYHEVNGVEELYDQSFDRGELHNLAKDMPEKVTEFREYLKEWCMKMGDTEIFDGENFKITSLHYDKMPDRKNHFGRRQY